MIYETRSFPDGERDCKNHCYHQIGIAKLSNPPTTIERCCNCGTKCTVTRKLTEQRNVSHGPFGKGE